VFWGLENPENGGKTAAGASYFGKTQYLHGLYNNQNTYKHSEPVKPIEFLNNILEPIFYFFGFDLELHKAADFLVWVYGGVIALASAVLIGIYKLITHLLHRRKQRFLSRNLNPWFSDEEIDRATRY
jgi:hypothetical protein